MRNFKFLFILLAVILIIFSFIFNVNFFASHFTRDGEINHDIYIPFINIFQVLLFLFGLIFLFFVFSNKLCANSKQYFKIYYKKILLFLFGILISLIIIEIGLYLLSEDKLSNFYLITKENKTETVLYKNLEFNMSFKLNSLGFRDKEFSDEKSDRIFRILILGDSMVFGIGVEQNETFAYLLESYLNAYSNFSKEIEIYNLGISSADPYVYLRVLEKYGAKYKPDLVITAFYVGNDIMKGNFKFEKLKFFTFPYIRKFIRKNLLNVDTLLNDDAFKNSKINPKYIDYTKQGLIAPYVILNAYYYPNISYNNQIFQDSFVKNSYTKDILLNLKSYSNKLKAEFLLIIIPEPYQVSRYGIEKQKEIGYIIDDILINDSKIQDVMKEFTSKNNIKVIDLLSVLKNHPKSTYYELDVHWNKAGHELIAKELYKYIFDTTNEKN